MRHRVKTKKLNRHSSSRDALARGLAVQLFKYGKIETTLTKAKYVRPYVEKIVTRARENTLANRRLLIAKLHDKEIVAKLLDVIGPMFVGQNGGYTRIRRTHIRFGDVTQMANFSFVKEINEVIKSDKAEKSAKEANESKGKAKPKKKVEEKAKVEKVKKVAKSEK